MCGILGILLADEDSCVNQMLFDGLTVLQHRGQDAAGMVTAERRRLHLRKENGLVADVFGQQHMTELRGNLGLGHVRYPTAGTSSCAEAQPLYTNYPFGICVAHNGNLTNAEELSRHVRDNLRRHVNTESDSEVLLNLFAENMATLLEKDGESSSIMEDEGRRVNLIFSSVEGVMKRCRGGYAGLYLINGIGLVGFRDPNGIRPIVFGTRMSSVGNETKDYVMASESVAIDTLGFELVRDIQAGEAIFVDMTTGRCHSRQCYPSSQVKLAPCIFEYVYFARPDSIMDGVSVYESRLKMGEKLAYKILSLYPDHDVDVVIPIPDTSRTSALSLAYILGRPYREGFIKNRYIARTFIMPGQATRKKSVRLKLNTIKSEFQGRNVLLVDDSIVRGTTSGELVKMAKEAGALKVYVTSAAPAVRYPNIYGIDIPTRRELIAYGRTEEEIAQHIGCDWIVYQDLTDLVNCIRESSTADDDLDRHELPPVEAFDTSCFSGTYVTGEKIDDPYFERLHELRNDGAKSRQPNLSSSSSKSDMTLSNGGSSVDLAKGSHHGCESMVNDRTPVHHHRDGCESIVNQ